MRRLRWPELLRVDPGGRTPPFVLWLARWRRDLSGQGHDRRSQRRHARPGGPMGGGAGPEAPGGRQLDRRTRPTNRRSGRRGHGPCARPARPGDGTPSARTRHRGDRTRPGVGTPARRSAFGTGRQATLDPGRLHRRRLPGPLGTSELTTGPSTRLCVADHRGHRPSQRGTGRSRTCAAPRKRRTGRGMLRSAFLSERRRGGHQGGGALRVPWIVVGLAPTWRMIVLPRRPKPEGLGADAATERGPERRRGGVERC